MFMSGIVLVEFALFSSPGIGFITMLASLPMLWILIISPVILLNKMGIIFNDSKKDRLAFISISVSISFSITFLALLIGSIADPDAPVPQTVWMLTTNVLFDGLTMMATYAILSRAIARPGLFRIPLAVIIDGVAAALFACASLYIAMIFTAKQLSITEVINALIARSHDGNKVHLGPYFWVMHTTFIPTVLYLGLILVTWIGKVILIPAEWFFGKGQAHSNPLKLTTGLCGIFVAVLTSIVLIVGELENQAKELDKSSKKPVTRQIVFL